MSPTTSPSDTLVKAAAAKAAARDIAQLSTAEKNQVLLAAADALLAAETRILAANATDIDIARANGTPENIIDRLKLDGDRLAGIAGGLRQVAALADPIGDVIFGTTLPNGLRLRQVRVPLGVMGMVYEARPNVTVDAFGLALKSGNVALLRGSKSARYTNEALVQVLQKVVQAAGLPAATVQLVSSESHDTVQELITARGLVDVVIPRGGAGLINAVVGSATVPTIETGTGNCHVYVDRSARMDYARPIVLNSKTRRTSVCNSAETLLLDAGLDVADQQLLVNDLLGAGVTLHGDPANLAHLSIPDLVVAAADSWDDEFLSMDMRVAVVEDIAAAIDHIRAHSTGHTEAIIAQDVDAIRRFTTGVDSAAISVNASTAFTDGEQYGMGAEIGISTQKLHARGPMGLAQLTSTTWIVEGEGHIRPV